MTLYFFFIFRIKPGFPGYLVAWNLGNETVTIHFRDYIKTVPDAITVNVASDFPSHDVFDPK